MLLLVDFQCLNFTRETVFWMHEAWLYRIQMINWHFSNHVYDQINKIDEIDEIDEIYKILFLLC
jgi:hypothetical protein